jgi:hypothetical protein
MTRTALTFTTGSTSLGFGCHGATLGSATRTGDFVGVGTSPGDLAGVEAGAEDADA